MLFQKKLANKDNTIRKLNPREIANAIGGVSFDTIINYEKKIMTVCKTFDPDPSFIEGHRPRFTVDNLPEELALIRSILFKNRLQPGELTASMISKELEIDIKNLFAQEAVLEKICPSYRGNVFINGQKTFFILKEHLGIVRTLFPKKAATTIINLKPPQKSARQLNEEAKQRLLEEK